MVVPGGTEAKILQKLEEQKKEEGTLPQLLEFYQRLLQIQSRVGRRIDAPNPSSYGGAVKRRLARGKPLMKFDELALDWSLLRDTFKDIAVLFADYEELFGSIPGEIIESNPSRVLTKRVVTAWFKGSELPSTTVNKNVSEALFKSLIHASLKPFLMSYSTVLIKTVDQENWRRGCCPVCGGNPDIAFLDTNGLNDSTRGDRYCKCKYQ